MIYYIFLKSTGEYMGSGTTLYDDETYGSTEVPCPDYMGETHRAQWNGTSWDVIAL